MSSRDELIHSICETLEALYGADVTEQIFPRFDDFFQAAAAPLPEELPLSERDVLLISYGDMLRDGTQHHPPLQVQHRFLRERVQPGINGLHLLPFFPYSSDDGFSVMDYYSVDPALGDWQHINALAEDFRLMVDAVFNHISAKSTWFQEYLRGVPPYDRYFIEVPPDTDLSAVVRPRALPLLTPFETHSGTKHLWTTFSGDQVDLNYANPDTLLAMLQVLLFYVRQGAQLIRLDAVAFLWKEIGTSSIHLEKTHLIIRLMRQVLNLVAPHVLLITETNVPHEENISYFGDGRNEAQMVYQFPLPPLVLHTLTAGDATILREWARSLQPVSEWTTFFNFTASHDGIGMRPATGLLSEEQVQALVTLAQEHGGHVSYKTNSDGSLSPYELNITYFDAITHPQTTENAPEVAVARFMVSQAIMLALAGVPGIYYHSLFGSRNDHEGVRRSGRYRSINRQKFFLRDLEAELDEAGSLRAQVFRRYMALIRIRTAEPAFHPLAAQRVLAMPPEVFAVERAARDDRSTVLALHNVTGNMVKLDAVAEGTWRDLLTGETWNGEDGTPLWLKPYQVCWLKRTE